MSWHGFEVGEIVDRDRVVAACEARLAAGLIIREEKKERMVEVIQSAPEQIVWQPQQPQGWGASPFNINNWRTTDGQSLGGDRSAS